MEVVEQASRENGIRQRELKKQKFAKMLVVETALAAEWPGGARRLEKQAPAIGRPERAGKSKETRGLEEAEGPEKFKPAVKRLEEAKGLKESDPVARGAKKLKKPRKPVTALLLSWSDYW